MGCLLFLNSLALHGPHEGKGAAASRNPWIDSGGSFPRGRKVLFSEFPLANLVLPPYELEKGAEGFSVIYVCF